MMLVMGIMLVALYIAASVMLAPGNTLASFFFYALVASGLLGLAAPKLTLGFFLVQCAYLDLFKRLMVFDGAVSFGDLFWVLGMAPVSIVGIASGLLLRMIFGAIPISRGDLARLAAAGAMCVAVTAMSYIAGAGIGGTMQAVANGASYALMLFILPILTRDAEAAIRLWTTLLWIFTPVAIYAVVQQVFGFQPFELEYLRTGLSIEIKQLEANRVRAFSTLNSPTSLSIVVATFAAMALSLGIRRIIPETRVSINPLLAVFLFGIFTAAWAASTVRVGILIIPLALAGTLVFQRRGFTTLFYLGLGLSFILLVASSGWMLMRIEGWTRWLIEAFGQNRFSEEMLNLNSYRDRLLGFQNVLLNPKAYTLFGMGDPSQLTSEFYNHDPISATLLRFGVVPLVIGLIVGILAVWRMHRSVFSIVDGDCRFVASCNLAAAIASIFVSMIGGNLLQTFPVNAVLWIEFGVVVTMIQLDRRMQREAEAPEEEDSPDSAPWPLATPAYASTKRLADQPSRLPGWQAVPRLRKSGRAHFSPPTG
jgi:hypothetical protein